MANQHRWQRGDFFLLHSVQYVPKTRKLRVCFENFDVGEAPVHALWGGRSGEPDWKRVRIHEETRGALLVPTRGPKAGARELAEIPADVVRAATDVDYRAYCARRAAAWAKRIGREITRLREKQGLTQESLARTSRLAKGVVSAIEDGRMEAPLATIAKLVEALGESLPVWLNARAN